MRAVIISYNLVSFTGDTSFTCGSALDTTTLTVLPIPSETGISGDSAICVGAVIHLTETGTAGGTWRSSNFAIATVDSGNVTGVDTGTATITHIMSNACGYASARHCVRVNPLPFAGLITGSATSECLGLTTTLTDTAAGGWWASSDSSIASVDSSGVATGVAPCMVTIYYVATSAYRLTIFLLQAQLSPGLHGRVWPTAFFADFPER